MIRLRAQESADYPAIAELYNRVNPWASPMSGEMIAHFGRTLDSNRPHAELLAEERHEPVALGVLGGWPGNPAMGLVIGVDERYRRRGVGTRLLRSLMDQLDVPRLASSRVSEECAPGIAFARRHGFEEHYRQFPSVLDLTRFEPSRFAGQRRAAEDAGLRFTTFTMVDDVAMRHRLHKLQNSAEADVPTPEPLQPVSFREWEVAWLEAPWFRPELLALAMTGDEPVALSYITLKPDGGGYNAFTGVASGYRGHGLGTAIKVEALRLAKAAGLVEVWTDNHSNNAPILAVNERLGYVRQPGVIGFMRTLAPSRTPPGQPARTEPRPPRIRHDLGSR
jgi:GNAT superfamily N-acetyltransferase